MAETHHTGIPRLQWSGSYPPCTPSVVITADLNPFCAGDSVTFTPTFACVDTAINISTDVKYGLLYNWYAATDARLICASGWEVPTSTKATTMQTTLGGESVAGGKMKEVGTTYWTTPNTGATNEVGFNGRGASERSGSTGAFGTIKQTFSFWLTNESGVNGWRAGGILYNSAAFPVNSVVGKTQGFSIRLIKTTTTLSDGEEGTYTGNDGKVYRTICIGTQEWLADNLCETKYRNGDTIPEVTDNSAWAALTTGALCAYNNDWSNAFTETNNSEIKIYIWAVNGVLVSSSSDPFVSTSLADGDRVFLAFTLENGNTYFSNVISMVEKTEGCVETVKYGPLYNWYAATDVRNICSEGWEIPSVADFNTLKTYLGGNTVAGGKLKETGTTYWNSPNTGATNEVGFNGRGTGVRWSGFSNQNESLVLWTRDSSPPFANRCYIYFNSAYFDQSSWWFKAGFSIRPKKISTTLTHGQTGTYTDPSGFQYPTICIGTQEWVACNIITQHYRNGDPIPEVTDESAWDALTTGALCAYNNDWSNVLI